MALDIRPTETIFIPSWGTQVSSVIDAIIAEFQAAYDAAIADFEAAADAALADFLAAYNAAITQINALIADVNALIADVEALIAEIEALIGAEIPDDSAWKGGFLQIYADQNDLIGQALHRDGRSYFRPDGQTAEHIAVATALAAAARLLVLPGYGQSNRSSQAQSAITRRVVNPGTCLHFANGRHSPGGDVWNAATATDFVPAAEDINLSDAADGEGAGMSSLMRWLDRDLNGAAWPKNVFAAVNAAMGGRTLEELSKGSGTHPQLYDNLMRMVRRAVFLADVFYDGLPAVVPFVPFGHGESPSADAATYSTVLQALLADLDADIKDLDAGGTGQSEDVHLVLYQVSSDENSTTVPSSAFGQVLARDAQPTRIHIAAPRYWCGLIDNTHLDGPSMAVMDEYIARGALRMVPALGGDDAAISSLRVVRATRSGADWTLRLRKPTGAGAVYFETTQLPDITTTKGFRATDGGSPDTISSVTIDNTAGNDGVVDYDATITVTLDGAPAGAAYLTYANGSGTTGQDRPAAWGNVAAHSDDVSLADGRELIDWLEIFEETT